MNHSEAVTIICKNYNEPLDVRAKLLKDWMIQNVPESDVNNFTYDLLRRNQFFPKIYDLEKMRASSEIAAENAWIALLPKSAHNDMIIDDVVAHYVVSGYGSWDEFCLARDGNREWTHKDFIKRYTEAYEYRSQLPEPAPLAGYVSRNLRPGKVEKIMIAKNMNLMIENGKND